MAGFQGVTAPGGRYDTVPGIPMTQGARRKIVQDPGGKEKIVQDPGGKENNIQGIPGIQGSGRAVCSAEHEPQ